MLLSAIKRPGMKYPRATIWCLDAGMILMIGGGIGVAAILMVGGDIGAAAKKLSIPDDVVFKITAGALLVGLILYAISIHLLKVNVDVESESTRLHRIK